MTAILATPRYVEAAALVASSPSMTRLHNILLGDIGGTHARFALAAEHGASYDYERTLMCAEFATPAAAIQAYLASVGAAPPVAICLAAAGPRTGDTIQLTNNPWHLSASDLAATLNAPTRLLNDFEAVAYALPGLTGRDTRPIGPQLPPALRNVDFRLGVIGPGTGLGAAGLICESGTVAALVTEAGHVGFAPENSLQSHIRDRLLTRYERLSDERLVSGAGLENIYWALGSGIAEAEMETDADTTVAPSAAEIFARYQHGQDPRADQAVTEFYRIFGQVAGNFALAMGAFTGIYLYGGMAQRYPDLLAASPFREAFETKGRLRRLMERVPSVLITHPQPGLLGALMASRLVKTPSDS